MTFAHPMQAYFRSKNPADPNADPFFAIGTYKGAATGGKPHCIGHMTGKWNVYTDGVRSNGTYFCKTQMVNAFGIGSNPRFAMRKANCADGSGWAAYVNGKRVDCRVTYDDYATGFGVMLEAAKGGGPVGRSFNLDVRFSNLQFRSYILAGWSDLGATSIVANRDYVVTRPSRRRVDAYLPPLN